MSSSITIDIRVPSNIQKMKLQTPAHLSFPLARACAVSRLKHARDEYPKTGAVASVGERYIKD
jgi:hypothetical protein